MNLEPNEEIVYSSDGSLWKVIGNSNVAIALLILIALFALDFLAEDVATSPLFIPLIFLELGLIMFWIVLVYKQTKLTSLFVTNQRVIYFQSGFGKKQIIHTLPYALIKSVRVASRNVVLIPLEGKPIPMEYVGDHKKVYEMIKTQWEKNK